MKIVLNQWPHSDSARFNSQGAGEQRSNGRRFRSGVAGLIRLLASEWAKYGITVNAIAPGYMATNNTAALRADPVRSKEILDRIPLGRWGLPADIGGPAVFLASDAAAYVTGHVLAVDGGWLAR